MLSFFFDLPLGKWPFQLNFLFERSIGMPTEEYDQERQKPGESRSKYNSRDEITDANIDDSCNLYS